MRPTRTVVSYHQPRKRLTAHPVRTVRRNRPKNEEALIPGSVDESRSPADTRDRHPVDKVSSADVPTHTPAKEARLSAVDEIRISQPTHFHTGHHGGLERNVFNRYFREGVFVIQLR